MKILTPLKVSMSLSLLAHVAGVAAYYAFWSQPHVTKVKFQNELPLEIEVVGERLPVAAPVRQKVAALQVLPEPKPMPLPAKKENPASSQPDVLLTQKISPLEEPATLPAPAMTKSEPSAPPAKVGTSETAAVVTMATTEAGRKANYLFNPQPGYPEASRRRKEEGLVILAVRVSEEGLPSTVQILQSSGFPRLDEAAITAVSHWRFTPAKLGNQSIASQIEVPIRFRLSDINK
jgi:protein TonB